VAGVSVRRILHEAAATVRACRHPRLGFVCVRASNGTEQVRRGCLDCGWRELESLPYAEHPNRDLYPLVVPQRSWGLAPDYRSYLASEAWAMRRDAAKARAGNRCQVCRHEGRLEVHHNDYSNLGRELEFDLCVLCRGCHALFSTNGRLAKPDPELPLKHYGTARARELEEFLAAPTPTPSVVQDREEEPHVESCRCAHPRLVEAGRCEWCFCLLPEGREAA